MTVTAQFPARSTKRSSTIALTRTPQAAALAACFEKLGLEVLPIGHGENTGEAVPLEAWIVQLMEGEFDDVIFTSAQGVALLLEMARQTERETAFLSSLHVVRKFARGPKPARALSELGVDVDIICRGQTPEAILEQLGKLDFAGRVVGIQPFDQTTEAAIAALVKSQGGLPRRVLPSTTVDPVAISFFEKVESGTVNAVCFLTERTAAWLFDACQAVGLAPKLAQSLRRIPVIASEPATAILRRRGVHPDLTLSHATIMQPVPYDLALTLGIDDEPRRTPKPGNSGRHRVVIVGNGMVSYKLCDRLTEGGLDHGLRITVLGEETWPAYDRVHLSEYFSGKTAEDLVIEPRTWYEEREIELCLKERVDKIDRDIKVVVTSGGREVPYDSLILATGAEPFIPPVPGLDKAGVFVYRTIEDLEAITAYAARCKVAAVIGGGLLGLEAAKAARDLGLETHIVEMAPRLMPRQLDDAGARLLCRQIESMGLKVHLNARTSGILGDNEVSGIRFADGERLSVDIIIVSAGIRPRDSLARSAGLAVEERGGIIVNSQLQTSDPNIFGVGECVVHEGTVYGLVAPGYEMATVVANTLLGRPSEFQGTDMSTKLKLLGVEVASAGDPFADEKPNTATVVYQDLVSGVYKKLIVCDQGKTLHGAVFVGDTTEYGQILPYAKSGDPLPVPPDALLLGQKDGAALPMPDTAQICSCNNVLKLDIVQAIETVPDCSIDTIKKCTKAGTGCGGCMPMVTDLFNAEMQARGKTVKKSICEHFDYSRQELYDIVRLREISSFQELIHSHGRGHGCEICKPAVAAILASTHAEPILNHATLQDTNDRFLANIQRRGLYSVVPRIPGGEITPEKLIAIGQVAQKYELYTKITGGQRIDLFGARVEQLPEIWEELIAAGFESGHAYGKALRTVKSCVGSTWCRFGVQDSVGFAIRVENRYKGLRSPHKLKSAVSGCIRECAEAQSKDFGLIATEKGYNLYVCGNGGSKPRHADLLASDVDEETVIKYIDRFLMYYIRTADKLMRTSVWIEKLEGGVDHVRNVVVHDSLNIAAELEADMQKLVDSYLCEWKDVVENPEKRDLFRHFAGPLKGDAPAPMIEEREQAYPAPWPKVSLTGKRSLPVLPQTSWVRVAEVSEVPDDGGIAVKYGNTQLAVFNFKSRGEWFATQNMCPHKRDMILARGMVGDAAGIPKVACPFHKKTFSLTSGECLSGDDMNIAVFPIKVEDGAIYLELPSEAELDRAMDVRCSEPCAEHASQAAE